jgi:hypothetical protein
MNSEDLKMPKFGSEREEAEWWDANPEFAFRVLQRARSEGRLGRGTVARRVAKPSIVELDPDDAALADRLAERKGLEGPSFLKMLIHDALQKEKESVDRSSAA